MAEEVKITIGCVYPRPGDPSMIVKGRDLRTGLAKEFTMLASEVQEALRRPARQITDQILWVLEQSSPELVADIAQNGIVLTGGGSQIYGMDLLIQERTQMPCMVAGRCRFLRGLRLRKELVLDASTCRKGRLIWPAAVCCGD